MADRPIIFSAGMIHALLDGRKSQTRRILGRTGEGRGRYNIFNPEIGWSDGYVLGDGNASWRERDTPWKIGDRLWVREAFITGFDIDDEFGRPVGDRKAWYRATDRGLTWYDPDTETTLDNPPWRSSTQMPRWASRLTLIVTDVRVQRIQDISAADAIAEGCHVYASSATIDCDTPDPRQEYRRLWNSLHGPGAWDRNPWVAALTFETHRQNIDRMEPTNEN